MRTVFFGATQTGHRCCERLLEMGEKIAGIVTMPRDYRISHSTAPVRNVNHADLQALAKRHGVPCLVLEGKMNDSRLTGALEEWGADFALVSGWYYLVPRSLRARFRLGVAGLHSALLPKYRGGAPLVWAVLNGETQAGVTLFYFDDGVDSGDVVGQIAFPIGPDAAIDHVLESAARASVELVETYVPLIANGSAPRRPQNEAMASRFPQRAPEDGRIAWSELDAKRAHDWIRAQSRPYPGAFTGWRGANLTVWKAARAERKDPVQPGEFIVEGNRVFVGCAENSWIELLEVQAGEESWAARDWADGALVSKGRFEEAPRAIEA